MDCIYAHKLMIISIIYNLIFALNLPSITPKNQRPYTFLEKSGPGSMVIDTSFTKYI